MLAPPPPTLCQLFEVLLRIINLALGLAGVAALAFLLLGGLRFILSGGEPEQVKKAKETLTWAVVGLVLILLAFAIMKFLGDIVGFDFLKIQGLDCP